MPIWCGGINHPENKDLQRVIVYRMNHYAFKNQVYSLETTSDIL